MEKVIFSVAHNRVINFATERNGEVVGAYGGQTLEQLAESWDGPVEVLSAEAAREREEAAATSAFEPIDAERWEWLLNCLPPMNRRRMGGSESFALSEAHTARIHLHAVRLRLGGEDRYFEGRKLLGTPHADLVAECRALQA